MFALRQALQTDAYNHYTAIYCLLLEKLRQHRSQLAAECRGADGRRRRPSSIADQAMMNSATPRPVLASTRRGAFSQTTDCVSASGTPGAAAAAGTGSGTTTASPGGGGSSTGGTATTPTYSDIETAALTGCLQEMFPSGVRCVPSSRAGGRVITTSIDEGVELDSDLCSTASIYSTVSGGGVAGASDASRGVLSGTSSSIATASAAASSSIQSISTGIGSPFMSFDSNVEADLMSSLSSCNVDSITQPADRSLAAATSSPRPAGPATTVAGTPPVTMTPPFSSKFLHGGAGGGKPTAAEVGGPGGGGGAGGAGGLPPLRQTRSPVSFREGRRASDGAMLAQQGVVVAFRQQLRETTKTRGVTELRQTTTTTTGVAAASKTPSRGRVRQLSLDGAHPATASAVDDRPPKLGTKRRSYPSSADSPVDDEPQKIGGAAAGGYASRGPAPLGTATTPVSAATVCPADGCPSAAVVGATTVVFPLPKSAGESLHQNIVQTRLQQLLQSARGPAAQAISATAAAASQQPISELHSLHQQLQQLHVSPSVAAASSSSASAGGQKLPAADVEGAPAAVGAAGGGAAATAIFHSTVVPPRLMRRHFVRQSSHKMPAPPLSTTTGLTIDDDFDVLQWQPVCELLPQLSPTFEETNEEEDASADFAAKDEATDDANK